MMHYMMGLVRERDGRLGEAAIHYREALRLLPGDLETRRLLDASLAALGWPGETAGDQAGSEK